MEGLHIEGEFDGRPSIVNPLRRTTECTNVTRDKMAAGYEPGTFEEAFPPGEEKEYVKAKAFFLTVSPESGMNLYDHLVNVISTILRERPDGVVDSFERISFDEKRFTYVQPSYIRERSVRSTESLLAEIEKSLFNKSDEDASNFDDLSKNPLPNLIGLSYYFELAGMGFSETETTRIWLSMKKLVENYPVNYIRFWGKILGIELNYYVVEAELIYPDSVREDDLAQVKPKVEDEVEKELETLQDTEFSEGPKPRRPPRIVVPPEDVGTGTNKYCYFVASAPGLSWKMLPPVEPEQIVAARKITKLFTGRLESPVRTFPIFPGKECNYLRAQIARITGATVISPLGFYSMEEDVDEEQSGAATPSGPSKNEEFEGLSANALAENLDNWVHHTPFILPQGRCTFWSPARKPSEEDEQAEEDEQDGGGSEEIPQGFAPEFGPPLLNPVNEDRHAVESVQAWTTTLSSQLLPQFAVATLRSNIWPGAFAFASGKKFENLYVGWGFKSKVDNHDPAPPPALQDEFQDSTLLEMDDPSPDDEKAHRVALLAAMMNDDMPEDHDEPEEEEENEDD